MNSMNENISFLKNFVKRRETYIRFSPIGTAIMGLLYILYYFLQESLTKNIPEIYLFLSIAILSICIVTILSMLNSERKGEDILPASIRHIIINLIVISIAYFCIVFQSSTLLFEHVVASAFIFYGLLVIVSRSSLPRFIVYFGILCFALWILIFGPLFGYIQEVILIGLGLWHIIMAIFLKINNDKNG